MDTIKNYIRYYKDVTFEESPFNDVDNAIFCLLVYIDLEKTVEKAITMKDAGKKFFSTLDYKKIKNESLTIRKAIDNFELLFNGKRYRNIILFNYEKIVDEEKQFCAMTYKLPDGTIFIAYEGTDDSLIGWREDFEMIYKFPVPSQKMAINYIDKVVKFSTKKVIVGGHSKGGNLAMTASMYAKPYIKRKIIKVYNNDGPGFKKEQYESKEYKAMLHKLKTFIPEESIVGLLLRHSDNYITIKSNGISLFEHDLNNWNCYGPIFIKGTMSENSKNMEKRILYWLNDHDDTKRQALVDTLFDMFEKCDITLFSQLRQFKLSRVIKLIRASRELDKETKDLVLSAFKILLIGDDRENFTNKN